MKSSIPLIALLALSAGLHANEAAAEPHLAKVVKIVAKPQPTPDYQARGPSSKKVEARDWYEIEAEVKIVQKNASEYIPELKVNWYAVVKDKAGKETKGKEWPVLLSGESTYKDVRVKDGTVYLSAYIQPKVLERYLGDGHLRESDFKAFAVTLSADGVKTEPVAEEEAWWSNWNNREYDREAIVAKSETPFAMMWIDRYPAEKAVQ